MKTVRWIAAVCLGLLALTGCVTPAPTVAAIVNKAVIPVDRVESVVTLVRATEPTADAAEVRQAVVTWAIQAEIARGLAQREGIALTDSDRAAFLVDKAGLETYAKDPTTKWFVDAMADTNTVLAKVGEDKLVTEIRYAAVQVNPRYGTWSAQRGSTMGDTGSLSQPAPTAAER